MRPFLQLLFVLLLPAVLAAEDPAALPPAGNTPKPGDGPSPQLQADEVAAFLDPVLTEAMRAAHIPGLAAAVVQGDRLLYSKGHGWANVEREVPVRADRTVFPLGSISKLVTTIAVLQQVEQGRLDLDADIETYLGAGRIKDEFETPVTLRHLLTHTDGFDIRWLFGGAATDASRLPSLDVLLAELPPRIAPSGQVYLYSDVGLTLAGHLVETVTGKPFEDYVQANVLEPLGLERSTFARPLPPSLLAARATGYEDTYDGAGTNRVTPLAYPLAAPAAALAASADDVARLMMAQLGSSRAPARALLRPETMQWLTERQFSHHAEIPGTCFGYYEYLRNGQRAVLHGGLMLGFTSVLLLLPEHDIGLFVVINKYGLVSLLEEELVQRFLDHYFPSTAAFVAAPANATAPAHPLIHYEGRYRSDQYSRRSTDKIALASGLAVEIVVKARPDGRLHFEPFDTTWEEVAPNLFQCTSTGERVTFHLDADGQAQRLLGSAQFMTYHRVSWFDRLAVQAGLTGACVSALLLGGFATIGYSLRDAVRRPADGHHAALWTLRALSSATALLVIAFLGLLYWAMRDIDITGAFLGPPASMQASVRLPPVFTACGIIAGLLGLVGTRGWLRGRRERWVHLGIGMSSLFFVPVLHYWNLL